MLKKLTHFVREKIHRQVRQPIEEMTRLQRVVRYCYHLTRFCIQQLNDDRALDMAAALTYRTIFSLVPTIILALIVFRAFVSFDQAQGFLESNVYNNVLALDSLEQAALRNADEVEQQAQAQKSPLEELVDGDDASKPAKASEEDVEKTKQAATQTVKDMVNGFVQRGYEMKVGSIGGVGLLLLVWAAVALVVTVENYFNRIYQCHKGRAWHMRIMLYWAVLTLGPVLLAVSVYLTGRISATAEELPIIGALFQAFSSFAALGASWLLLFLVYILMPNTTVHVRPAIIGAFVSAVLWELGKLAFKFYAREVGASSIYGSLGLLPLFLIWVYLTWLIVLFGLEITYVLQTMKGRLLAQEQRKYEERDLITDARYVLPMMTAIGDAFEKGYALDDSDLAQQLRMPEPVAANFCRRLEAAGLIHRLDDRGYALARPAERIAIADLLKLGRSLSHLDEAERDSAPGWALIAELNAAETEASAGLSLADAIRHRDDGQQPS